VGGPVEVRGELLKGAFSALYYFTLLVGYESGCREIDFLGTRPLLQDGLFRYKRKWGTRVEDSPVPRGDILLQPLRFDEAVRGFLASNPLVVRAGKSLVGKVLLEGGPVTRERLAGAVERLHTPGLSELRIFSRDGFDPEAREWSADPSRGVSVKDLRLSSRPADDYCRL
jgi:hypothetical protein